MLSRSFHEQRNQKSNSWPYGRENYMRNMRNLINPYTERERVKKHHVPAFLSLSPFIAYSTQTYCAKCLRKNFLRKLYYIEAHAPD